jgi:hypothetical protein
MGRISKKKKDKQNHNRFFPFSIIPATKIKMPGSKKKI